MRRHFFMGSGRFASAAVEGVALPALTGNPAVLAHWDFDAASTAGLSGSDIDSIASRAGGSHTLLTPGNMPSQTTRGGKKVATFVAASTEYMQIASACGINTANGCTFVVVGYNPQPTVANYWLLDVANSASTSSRDRYSCASNNGSNGYRTRKSSASASGDAQAGVTPATGLFLLVSRFTGGTGVATQHVNGDGTPEVSGSIGAPTGLSHTTLGALYASSALSAYAEMDIFTAAILEGDIGATAAEELAAWAVTNYGITNAA